MADSGDLGNNADERARRRVHLARLEADVTYFQARLEILGEPRSVNQLAQRRVFKLLHKSVGHKILEAKRRRVEEGG